MELRHIQATLQFLERVTLQGAEIPVFLECKDQLHLLAKEMAENNVAEIVPNKEAVN